MKCKGIAHVYGDHVDTDVIIPARYLNTADPKELAKHCMEDIDTAFVSNVKPGDFIIAGRNFGCGSSREHAPVAIKASGISCVVAESFARIFFRNAINTSLPVIECPEAARDAHPGHEMEADLGAGILKNLTLNKTYCIEPLPPFIQELIQAGGLVNYTRTLLER
ncbi:MAG: 3-isopropylmalate dehydratase small subunit [Bacillota bacterium]